MKTIDKTESPQEYFRHFQELISTQKVVLVWQIDKNSKKRSLSKVTLLSSRREDNALKALGIERFRELHLPEEEVYFYVENKQLMFKSTKLEIDGHQFSGSLPDEVKILNDDEHETVMEAILEMVPPKSEGYIDYTPKKKRKYSSEQSDRDREIFEEELRFVSLDEEDRIYADVRGAPRARPKKNKKVTIKAFKGLRKADVHHLFDLSRGGLSIIVEKRKLFSPGDVVEILSFDDKKLDNPMLAEVKSVRGADEQGKRFKVGMQFA
tara:strand:- start:5045 stop:5842 length:798 start_codon:yes stop_codon:yes gene_type:complete